MFCWAKTNTKKNTTTQWIYHTFRQARKKRNRTSPNSKEQSEGERTTAEKKVIIEKETVKRWFGRQNKQNVLNFRLYDFLFAAANSHGNSYLLVNFIFIWNALNFVEKQLSMWIVLFTLLQFALKCWIFFLFCFLYWTNRFFSRQ